MTVAASLASSATVACVRRESSVWKQGGGAYLCPRAPTVLEPNAGTLCVQRGANRAWQPMPAAAFRAFKRPRIQEDVGAFSVRVGFASPEAVSMRQLQRWCCSSKIHRSGGILQGVASRYFGGSLAVAGSFWSQPSPDGTFLCLLQVLV